MPRTVTHFLVAFVLATCVVCPVVEVFDQWDHTLQTGDDTESALVIAALCLGATFLFLCVFLKAFRILVGARVGYAPESSAPLSAGPDPVSSVFLSPPLLNLRI